MGDIIGGFSPSMFSRTNGYANIFSLHRPAEDSFLFRKLQNEEKPQCYFWTGANECLFNFSELYGLDFGGHESAIFVSKDFTWGTTSESETFGNPALLAPETEGPMSAGSHTSTSSPKKASGVDFELAR